MPSPDDVIPPAFALYNSPRRYALLVGSGISHETGIPTASEITDDLIRQIAGGKIPPGQKPQDWYQETHGGMAPTFTGLFEGLAKSKEDRTAILRQYFEPSGKEGSPTSIEPSTAHQTVARLVRDGIISMIITTNFDPLLEEAIKRVTGRDPVIITHESSPERMEIAGDHCRIVKVNGSYPDTDLKLTPADLADYNENLKDYLHRIFSEYGLLICGWSGEHDAKLVKILTADRVRRFAIFWCSRDAPEKIPEEIRSKLHLSTIGIATADQFFGDLESRIQLLRRHERRTSLTIESAIKKVKEALRDPRPELILSDLIHEETDRVLVEVNRSDFVPTGPIDGKSTFRNRLEELERTSAPLSAMVATISYYDNGSFTDLIAETIDRLINLPPLEVEFLHNGQRITGIDRASTLRGYLLNLRHYPAFLTIYASGITAVYKENFTALSAILEKPKVQQYNGLSKTWELHPYYELVNVWAVIWTTEQWTLEFSAERFGKIGNPYYYPARVVHSIISPLIPNEYHFDAAFDIFEYLMGITYVSESNDDNIERSFVLMSRVRIQTAGYDGRGKMKFPASIHEYFNSIGKKIEHSKFFDGVPHKFLRGMIKYSRLVHVNPPETDIPQPRGGYPNL